MHMRISMLGPVNKHNRKSKLETSTAATKEKDAYRTSLGYSQELNQNLQAGDQKPESGRQSDGKGVVSRVETASDVGEEHVSAYFTLCVSQCVCVSVCVCVCVCVCLCVCVFFYMSVRFQCTVLGVRF